MKLFDVYPLFDIEPVKASGSYLWDKNGQKYLDLYGGHAVISIGHSHPHYVARLKEQLDKIAFYSNSVVIPQQQQLANLLGKLSGYDDYQLFLCNSGAEANENALKVASFYNGKKKLIAFKGSFHGRTSAAVEATDDLSISAPINRNENVIFLPLNDDDALEEAFASGDICAAIIEGIQGVGGIQVPTPAFLEKLRSLCTKHEAMLILDEVQSGYGRTGKFFAHQFSGIAPDLITIAKGMGNGFPVAGVLISPRFKPRHSMLGTTFGGNYLACVAAIAVLEVMEQEQLMQNAENMGNFLLSELKHLPYIKELRGHGLMIGIELEMPCAAIRQRLLTEHHIFTGSASQKHTLRILPALNMGKTEAETFLEALEKTIKSQ